MAAEDGDRFQPFSAAFLLRGPSGKISKQKPCFIIGVFVFQSGFLLLLTHESKLF
jgi:hypothetical protein